MVEPLRQVGYWQVHLYGGATSLFFFLWSGEQVHLYGGAARRGFKLVAGAPAWWSCRFGRVEEGVCVLLM